MACEPLGSLTEHGRQGANRLAVRRALDEIVGDWIATAKHQKTGRLCTGMACQPMFELPTHLRAKAKARRWTVVDLKAGWRRAFESATCAARVVACCVATVGLPAVASAEINSVLVLYSNGRLVPGNVEGDRGLHQTLGAPAGQSLILSYEFLDAPRFGGPAYDEVVAAYLREKYASRPPRVIVAVADEALGFLLRQRQSLFPRVPVVHAGVDRSVFAAMGPLPPDVVGAPADFDFSPTLDLALRWHPRARRLVIVTGASERDRGFEARLRKEVVPLEKRAAAEFLLGLPTPALLRRLGELGDDAVVFTPGFFRDGEGREFTPHESVRAMAAASRAPVYSPFITHIGTGIVGGYMASFEAIGREAGRTVNELLAGAAPTAVRRPEMVPQTLHVDWRQLRRWGLDSVALPPQAVVHFRPPTLLEAHRNEAIGAAVLLALQAGVIAWLLVERRRRRAAEAAERTRRSELTHASRLAVAGELTGSIAHEINQPLCAILSNADAADLILASGGDRREELRAILADIRHDDVRASEVIRRLRTSLAKHEVERRPFELNEAVREIDSVLGAEARRRRSTLEIRTAPEPVVVLGDRIEIQQVLVNLALNALQAVADLPEERRAIVVSVEHATRRACVTVRDRGPGIAPEDMPRLFDAFFTTKRGGMGLGLSIARTLVEAHGGRVWAENGTGEGAVFRVELPTRPEAGDASRVRA
jgi:signal transduction histidine kinase